MRLKTLAISDTHLGEETSFLSFPRGLQHLWTIFREGPAFWRPIFSNLQKGDTVAVDQLILVGDIADRTLSSTPQISAHGHRLGHNSRDTGVPRGWQRTRRKRPGPSVPANWAVGRTPSVRRIVFGSRAGAGAERRIGDYGSPMVGSGRQRKGRLRKGRGSYADLGCAL